MIAFLKFSTDNTLFGDLLPVPHLIPEDVEHISSFGGKVFCRFSRARRPSRLGLASGRSPVPSLVAGARNAPELYESHSLRRTSW
jgi:hypothetical protein